MYRPQATALEPSLPRMVFPPVLYPTHLGLKRHFVREFLDHYAKLVTLPPQCSLTIVIIWQKYPRVVFIAFAPLLRPLLVKENLLGACPISPVFSLPKE